MSYLTAMAITKNHIITLVPYMIKTLVERHIVSAVEKHRGGDKAVLYQIRCLGHLAPSDWFGNCSPGFGVKIFFSKCLLKSIWLEIPGIDPRTLSCKQSRDCCMERWPFPTMGMEVHWITSLCCMGNLQVSNISSVFDRLTEGRAVSADF